VRLECKLLNAYEGEKRLKHLAENTKTHLSLSVLSSRGALNFRYD